MFTRKTYRRIKPMVIILLFATLVLAMSSASAADDGIADDAAIADAVDYSVDEVSASSDDVAIDTESSDIYSVDDATVTEDDDASGEIIEDTVSDAASEEPKAPLASPSGSEESLGAGTEDVNIGLIQDELYGGDVCDFTVTVQSPDGGTAPGGTVTVTIIDTTVPEDTNRRTFVYTIPLVNGIAASGDATSVTINGVAVESPDDVLLWPYYRNEWDNGVQRFPDSVTIAYSGDDTYAPKTETKTLTVYPYEAQMDIDITQGQGRENEITYGNPLGLVLFEVYDPFEFDNPLYGGNLNVYIVNGDVVDPDDFDPAVDPVIKKTVVNINDGDGSITFDDILEEGYYLIGLYFDEENFPRYVTWEGFNIIKDTQVGPFVVSSNGLAYQTLAEALAVATEDDTITVIKEGIYKGTQNTGLEITKSVTIAAAGNLAVTFDCEENNNFITVKSGKTVTLKDVTVQNGKAEKGGAVYVESGALFNTDGVKFTKNVANVRGGAIYSEGEVFVKNSLFLQNDITTRNANVDNGGAAIYNYGGVLFVDDCDFTENLLNYVPRTADGPGDLINGIIMSSGKTMISDSTFTRNNGCYGGAITVLPLDGSTPTLYVDSCKFIENTAYDGTAIHAEKVPTAFSITNSEFVNNVATGVGSPNYYATGGAITINKCTGEGTISDCQFIKNTATYSGAIQLENSKVTIDNCAFTENTADANGIIYSIGSNVTISSSNFTDNVAGNYGGAVYVTGAANTDIKNSVFTGNQAAAGSAIIDFSSGDLSIDNCNITDNIGTSLGAIYVHSFANSVSIKNSIFTGNTAPSWRNIYTHIVPTVLSGNTFDSNKTTLAVNDITYGEDEVINGTYDSGTNLDFSSPTATITINGEEISAVANRTAFTKTIEKPNAGTYTAILNKISDANNNIILFDSISETYNVAKAKADVTVTAETVTYPTQATVVVNANVPGTYTIRVGNKDYEIEVGEEGTASKVIDLLQPGTYDIDLSADLGPNYEPISQIPAGSLTVLAQEGPFVVSSNGLGYATLAEALAVAQATGDTITVVEAGTYTGAQNTGLTVDKSVTIKADEGLEVIFDAQGNNNFITVAPDVTVTLSDITVTNGKAAKGAGVIVNEGSTLNVNNVDFTNNVADSAGGAIYSRGTVSLTGTNTFSGNKATYNGGAIYNLDGNVAISGTNTFTGNEAYEGGALFSQCYYKDSASVTIEGTNTFSNNKADDGGAAIYIYTGFSQDPALTITGTNTFSENVAPYGGAIYINGIASITGDNVFTGNKATDEAGGAIYADYGALTLDGAKFNANEAPNGGAIYVSTADVKISNAEFNANIAEEGAALYIEDVSQNDGEATGFTVTVTDSVFSGNTADKNRNIFIDGTGNIARNTFDINETEIKVNNIPYGEDEVINGTFDAGVNYDLTGSTVSLTINGAEVTATVTDGNKFTTTVTKPDIGTYPVVFNKVTDSDNNVYVPENPVETSFTVEKVAVVVTVTAEDVTYPTQATVVVNANIPGTYTIRVGNKDYAVVVGDTGSGSAVLDVLQPGTYEIDLSADLGPNYDPVVQIPAGTVTILAQTGPFVVSSNGLGYATLAEALAVAEENDIITVVEAGVYTGAGNIGVTIDKNIILMAEEGLDVVFDAKGADTNILTIANGNTVVLYGLAFTGVDNTQTKFGAVVNHGQLTVTDCKFYDNLVHVAGTGGSNGAAAIFSATDATGLLITGSTFTNNKAVSPDFNTGGIGAVASWATSGDVLIKNSVFESNEARYGGAVEFENLNQAAPAVVGCNFTNNIAYIGAGINFNDGCKYEAVENCTFTGNTIRGPQGAPTTGSMGAAICAGSWTDDSVLVVEGCKFIENKGDATDGSSGGAIRLANKASGIIVDSEFIGNEARIGSAISIGTINNEAATLTVQNCNFTDNNALMYGAVSIDSEAVTATITDSTFSGNTAPEDRNVYSMGTIGAERNTFDINATTIEVNDIPYGQDEVINGTFDAGVSYDLTGATVYLTINNEEVTATVIEGNKFTTTVTKPVVGTYPVVFNNVTDSNNNVYLPVNPVETSYTVYKATPVVEVNDTTAEWNTPVTIPVKVTDEEGNPVTGTVIVTVAWDVDGKQQVVELDENGYGEATFTINEALGEMTITANYTGNDNFESAKDTATLTITNSTDLDITVTANEVNYGEDTIITIVAKDGMDAAVTLAKVNVTIDDGEVQELEVGADGTINLGKLAAGEHNIVVTANDGFHKEATNSTVAKVNPAEVIVVATAEDYLVTSTGELIITVSNEAGDVISGTATVEIDGVIYAEDVNIANNAGSVVLKDLLVGKHNVKVTFHNPNYKEIENVTDFTVSKATPVVEVNDTTAEWGVPVTIPVKVTDENGNPLNGTVIVTVDWTVDGETQVVELIDGYGEATFVITEVLGDATITANYTGNDSYASVKGTATLTINDTTEMDITVTANEVDYGEDTIITVTAVNARDVAVTLAKVNVTIDDGEVQELEVGADGTINLGSLAAGEHNIVVTANDGIHKEATNSTVAIVNPIAAEVNASAANYAFDETGKLIVTVNDLAGNPLSGVIAVEIDDELYAPQVEITGGRAEIDLTGFEIGEHSVHVVFTNPNYRVVDDVTHFNVTKKTPVVSVTGTTVEYGDPATVKVKVTDEAGNPITGSVIVTASWVVDGETQVVELDENGEGQATFSLTGLGQDTNASINATYIANDNYTTAYNDTEKIFVTNSTDLSLEVTANEVDYGEDTIITIVAKDGMGATVTLAKVNVTIDDGEAQELEVGADGTINLGSLAAGEHNIVVTANDGFHKEATNSAVAKVNPIAAVVVAGAEDYPFTETGKLVINVTDANDVPIAGNVSIEIDGSPYKVVEIDGTVTVDLVGFDVGFHTVEVVFDNPNYRASEFVGGFNVTKATPVVSVTGTTVEYGQPATVKFTVSDPDGLPITTGSVIVTVDWLVDGETQVVELVEGSGEATFALAGVAPGTVNITVTYIENDNYTSAVNDTEKIIIKDSTDLTLEATSNEVTYGGDTILNVVATDGKGAQIELSKVNITIDGVTTEYPVDEDGNVNIGKLPAGDTEVTVSIDDEVYGHVETKVNATVSPAVPDLTVTPGEGNITIDVKDGETPISGIATVVIDGDSEHPITVQIDETGHVVVPIDAAPGNHAVEVIFNNDNYTEARQTVAVNVPKVTPIVYVNGTEVEYGTPATINITVTDEEGNPINGTVIVVASWEVDGETQVVELVDGKGEATFVLAGLGQGASADINATYVENDNYTTAYNDTEIIKITPSTELNLDVTANEATFGEDTILTIVAKDGADAEVPLTKVNVTVDGVTNEYDVDENGNVNLGNLSIGDHEITVSVDDGFHEEATADVNATVKPAEANVTVTPGEGNVTVEAKDKNDNPINGTAIIVVDGGEPIEVPIDETGKIEYPIDAEPGAHTVEVTFTNPDYENVTKTVVVNVPKYEATLTIANSTEPVYGQNVTIVPTLVPTNATGTITYYVDGSTAGTELAIGENFIVSGLTAGEHTIVAKYNGDGNYSVAESNTLTLNVAKAPLTFEVVDAIAYYPDTGTINVAASADDTFTILVNGVEYSVTVENGKGSVKVNEKLDVGEYDITWNIPDGDNYIGTQGSAIYQVVPAAPDFSIIGSPEINYGQNNTIIPTITEGATGNITYTIDGVEIGKTGVNENFTVEGLDVGEYTIVATYSGDNNYGTVKANFTFKVLPIDVVVSVSSDEVYYPNTGSINLTASAPGEYTVLVGNKTYTATVTTPGETVTIPVTDLFEVGKYDINVTAPASQNYNAVDTGAIGTYVVSKAKSVIEVTYDNATGKITVTLEGEEDHVKLSETISVEVDGVAISGAKTTDGVFVSEDLELTPGKHSVFAVFVGNENYLGSYDQLNLDIPKFGTAEVTVSAAPIKEGEEAVINITVKDGDKGLTGVVTVTLDGTDYAVDVTDGTGQLTVKNLVATTSPTTTYPITARFNGNDEYAEATGTGEINVTDWNDVIIVIAGGEDGAVATLIDTDLNNITGKVNVTVDGVGPQEYDVVDGKVNIPISEEGDHEITVDFAGDETHPAASKTDTVYVGENLIPTNLAVTVADIKYTEDAEVVVILKDEAGNLISGKVNITIGDAASKEVTVTGGHATVKFSGLNANGYTVVAEFKSDGTYASSVATATFNVKQLKTRIIARNMTTTAINVTEDGRIGQYFSWTLVDEKGRVLADKAVSIGFNANVYNRVTNASGQARLQINLQNSGPYTFAISFLGDENYEGCFEVVKIDVNKQKAQLTASGATYKASAKTKTLSATYKTKAGNPIVGKTVKFTVNGKTYSAKTDSKGVAKVNVSLTKAGSYTVEVKAPATNTYAETIKKVTLKLT